MGLVELIGQVARDASHEPGYQAQPLYVLLNIAVPLSVGMLVNFTRRFVERLSDEQDGTEGAGEVAD